MKFFAETVLPSVRTIDVILPEIRISVSVNVKKKGENRAKDEDTLNSKDIAFH